MPLCSVVYLIYDFSLSTFDQVSLFFSRCYCECKKILCFNNSASKICAWCVSWLKNGEVKRLHAIIKMISVFYYSHRMLLIMVCDWVFILM
jgi:hypothetical protein